MMYKILAVPFALLFTLPALACIELNGDARQGALLWGKVPAGSTVSLDEEALKVSGEGLVVLGFGRDEAGTKSLRVAGPQPCEQELAIAAREYRIQRVEGVPQRTVTPDPEDLERIEKRMAEIIAELKTPAYVARVSTHNLKEIINAKKVIKQAFS